MNTPKWQTASSLGEVLVTNNLVDQHWMDILTAADCHIEILISAALLSIAELKACAGSVSLVPDESTKPLSVMVEDHKFNLIYFDINPNQALEGHINAYTDFLHK
jgi:hypothetical protein